MRTRNSSVQTESQRLAADQDGGPVGTIPVDNRFTSLTDMLEFRASDSPSAVALRSDSGALTYRDLDERAGRVASAIRAHGTAPGARIAVLDRNTPVCIELLFGASRAGAVLIPLNWRLSPYELAEIAGDSQIEVLVVGAEFLPVVHEMLSLGTHLPTILVIDADEGVDDGYPSYASWIDRPAEESGWSSDTDRVVLQIYTSGTTGRFKGVMLTEAVMTAHLGELATMIGYTAESVNLTAMPLFHVAGIGGVLLGLVHGGETVLLRDADVEVIAHAITDYRVTHGFLVPVVVGSLLDRTPAIDWSHFETVVYGASAISVPLLQRAIREMDCSFVQIYGLTESRGASTLLPPEAHDPTRPELLRSCGRPLPWVTVRIADPETGSDVEPGTTGEIWIRSPQNMAGYWHSPEATADALVDGGWLRTGDAAHADAEGWIYIDDRIKDMIVSGGENIYPAEIERLLDGRSDVRETAVIGVPHDRWGETPAAFIVADPQSPEPDSDEILAYCRAHLARYKCPSIVEFVTELPRNASGKILKKQLREAFWADRERRVN